MISKRNLLMRLLDHSRHIKKGCKGLEKKMKPFSSLVQNGRDDRMQNPQRKKGRIKAVPEEAGDGVVEDGEAVGDVIGIEEMKDCHKLRRRNSIKVKLNVTGVSRWNTSHHSVPQKTNNST